MNDDVKYLQGETHNLTSVLLEIIYNQPYRTGSLLSLADWNNDTNLSTFIERDYFLYKESDLSKISNDAMNRVLFKNGNIKTTYRIKYYDRKIVKMRNGVVKVVIKPNGSLGGNPIEFAKVNFYYHPEKSVIETICLANDFKFDNLKYLKYVLSENKGDGYFTNDQLIGYGAIAMKSSYYLKKFIVSSGLPEDVRTELFDLGCAILREMTVLNKSVSKDKKVRVSNWRLDLVGDVKSPVITSSIDHDLFITILKQFGIKEYEYYFKTVVEPYYFHSPAIVKITRFKYSPIKNNWVVTEQIGD